MGENSIYTKVKDEVPVQYKDTAVVKNSLIANGCIIRGEVENSILFRGVTIEKGVKVKNSYHAEVRRAGEFLCSRMSSVIRT